MFGALEGLRGGNLCVASCPRLIQDREEEVADEY
jgi:hypothetical protein